ncbi:uncharacterized protein LOC114524692 [Dendronephthya gigantea]|uniref:uncharacterized protein LOC114524692 n=1 Tax=Dendronephthya gigantea TaxID=151771 RepID=UPI00106AEBB0|nr:uncharacterized protein LOC114524692 [Dendronephthya gigantea]XP_028401649.1 uncharacterized protein LOC114524692 [Dendronephthya gigantea]XP_028401650.1 uncharacterized protein LOC114524692 [Dendronephthya gigantea]
MLNLVFAILISTIFHKSLGYPSGAPSSKCGDMTPQHDGVSSQPAGTSPYSVKVEKPYYMPGENVRVSIESSSNDTIKGYLIQARQVGGNTAVGSFSSAPAGGKRLNCGNSEGAVTHDFRLNLKKVTFEWEPLKSLSGNISFFATVVKNKTMFWVKLESPELYKKDVPGASLTVQSPVITESQTTVPSHSQKMQTAAQSVSRYISPKAKETQIQSVQKSGITISGFSNCQQMPTTSQENVIPWHTKAAKTSMLTPRLIENSNPASIISTTSSPRIANLPPSPKVVSLASSWHPVSLHNDTGPGVTKPVKTWISTPIQMVDSTPATITSMHEANSTSSFRFASSTPTTNKTSCQHNDDAKCDGAQTNHGAMFIFFFVFTLVFWQNAV